tara:strand:+ start:50 stop:523 length:474 start_codon:yes stop_codon:yes gene_type:complete
MKVTIKDNFLPDIDKLNELFLYKTPHYWGHASSKDGNQFYHSPLDTDHPNLIEIHNNITKSAPMKLKMIRAYLNIQHQGMDGMFHDDDGDVTMLVMITDNPKKGGGEFEYKNEKGDIIKIEYKQNRLIIFDSKIKHRGLAYKENKPRITLTFKNKII